MLQRTWQSERGFSLVVVAGGLVAFLAATTIAIDVGMFMTARSQAQNSADAGALAGATALVFDDYNDRSAGGPAVQNAVQAATANQVMSRAVSVTPADVTFLTDPANGESNKVHVHVYRTGARGNAVRTLMGTFFGVPTANIDAEATAQASPANAETCVKPFTIPDKWRENTGPTDTFDMYDSHNVLLPNRDVYVPAGQDGYTGYTLERDKGTLLTIRAGTGDNISPSFYFSWKMEEGSGGDYYRDNIAGCNSAVFNFGDPMIQEPGNMVGPTNQGIDDLMAKDPDAYWDGNKVVSTMSPSPRVFPIPLYDPAYYAEGKASGRVASLRMANWIGFFLIGRSGNDVYGRIVPILGTIDGNAGPAPVGAFPRALRLVQ